MKNGKNVMKFVFMLWWNMLFWRMFVVVGCCFVILERRMNIIVGNVMFVLVIVLNWIYYKVFLMD